MSRYPGGTASRGLARNSSTVPLGASNRGDSANSSPGFKARVVTRSNGPAWPAGRSSIRRSEEHTSELQSRLHIVCRLLLEKKTRNNSQMVIPVLGTDHFV